MLIEPFYWWVLLTVAGANFEGSAHGTCLQALQMRKNPYVSDQLINARYDPDVHTSSTILSGSTIHQVYDDMLAVSSACCCSCILLHAHWRKVTAFISFGLCARPDACLSMSACAQVWNDRDEQDECLAMVARTGLNTTVGKMLHPLVHRHRGRKHLRPFMGFYREVKHFTPSPCPECAAKPIDALQLLPGSIAIVVTDATFRCIQGLLPWCWQVVVLDAHACPCRKVAPVSLVSSLSTY